MVRLHLARRLCAAYISLIIMSAPSHAHHGRDFLLVQTAHLPETGQVYAIARQDYIDEGDEKEWEFEPAVIGSVTDWLALEVHSHIEKARGESTVYESTAGVGQVRLTPPGSAFALGGAIEYEAIRHDEDVWEFSGIASYETSEWVLGLNLLGERESASGAETEWGYAAGARRTMTDKVAAGIEVEGSLEGEHEGELLFGVFADATSSVTLNVGVGTGFNDGPDFSFRSAFIFRFR